MGRAVAGHRLAHQGELAGTAQRRLRRGVFVDRRLRQGRPVGPDLAEQVQVGAQLHPGALERGAQLLGRGQAEHLAIDRDGVPGGHFLQQPLDVMGGRAR